MGQGHWKSFGTRESSVLNKIIIRLKPSAGSVNIPRLGDAFGLKRHETSGELDRYRRLTGATFTESSGDDTTEVRSWTEAFSTAVAPKSAYSAVWRSSTSRGRNSTSLRASIFTSSPASSSAIWRVLAARKSIWIKRRTGCLPGELTPPRVRQPFLSHR